MPPPGFNTKQKTSIDPRFQRLALLTGAEAAEAIAGTKVTVAGLGGVGSWCAEALARSGIASLSIIDSDAVSVSNINRQVQADSSTIGQSKAEALARRIREINPACKTVPITETFLLRGSFEETAAHFGIADADYVIDAIDSINSKLDLIETAAASGKILFSSMGMAFKLDPALIRSADIWKTKGCPLAKLVRHGLKERGFEGHFTAVYSEERLTVEEEIYTADIQPNGGKKILGSAVTVTAAAGLILASLVLRDICSRFSGKNSHAGGKP